MPVSDTFTEMVTTTMRHHKRKVVDNVSNHNGTLTLMRERGNVKTDADGGYEIAMPLSYAENSTYQRYYGSDQLNIGGSDVLTAAKYDWRQIALHVTSNGRELRMNRSEERMISLVKARVAVALDTAANNLSIDLYSDGALTNQIGGFAHQIQSNGQGTVGGIDSGTYTFWRNLIKELTAPSTYATLRNEMNLLWMSLVRGVDKPDVIVLSHDLYSTYEGGQQDLQRYADGKLAQLGFETLKFKTSSMIFDDNTNYSTTAKLGFFLNTKYLYLIEHPEARWTEDEHKTPINQDATVVPIYWMGQVCCSNRSLQGRVHDLS